MRLCAFCHSPRSVELQRHLRWTSVVGFMILSGLLSFIFWRELNPRAIPLFVSLWVIGEMMALLRYRLGLPCPKCGFDPLLYKRDPKKASARVRDFYERKKASPDFVLTGKALIEVQKRLQAEARSRAKNAKIRSLSRAVERHLSPDL